jgi:imidazolonepropionase-like amidohydrolase
VAALTPGFVDAAANVGIAGGAGEVTSEVTPEFVVSEAIDLLGSEFAWQLDQGITTVHVTPSTENVFAGFGSVLKTAGQGEGRWLQKQSGLCLSMCNDPTSRNASRGRPETVYMRQPTNRMGVVWILRSRLHTAGQESPANVAGLDMDVINPLLADMVSGKTPAYAVSRTSYDIETLYRIGDEFGFVPVLVGGDESYKVVDLLREKQARVVFTALSTGAIGAERSELRWSTPVVLSEAGIEFALAGDRLLEQARFARRYGLSAEAAVAAITGQPAKILGVADQVGTIAPGLAADLVAFSGDPLQITSSIEWVMIDGQLPANGEGQ